MTSVKVETEVEPKLMPCNPLDFSESNNKKQKLSLILAASFELILQKVPVLY